MKGAVTAVTGELCQADRALQDLLQTLLAEVPSHCETSADAATAEEAIGLSEIPAVEVPLNIPVPAPLKDSVPGTDREARTRPAWAEGELKALVVRVGRLRMAVPLVRLASIQPAGSADDAVRLPGQPAWHRGVISIRGQQVVRVDLAALLNLDSGQQDAAYLLLIGEGRFGLEIDSMEEPLTLDADDIRWRQPGEGRNWILGMLPGQMSVLLDLEVLSGMLAAATQK